MNRLDTHIDKNDFTGTVISFIEMSSAARMEMKAVKASLLEMSNV